MSLAKWEPMRKFEEIFDRYSQDFNWPFAQPQELLSEKSWSPKVDISETETELKVIADLPDVKKEDVKVDVTDGVLTLQGEKRHQEDKKEKHYHRIERQYGSFQRSFTLPGNINTSKIEAQFGNGVLTIHIPKAGEVKPNSIEIKVS